MDRELWLAIAVAAIVVILILALRLTVWEQVGTNSSRPVEPGPGF